MKRLGCSPHYFIAPTTQGQTCTFFHGLKAPGGTFELRSPTPARAPTLFAVPVTRQLSRPAASVLKLSCLPPKLFGVLYFYAHPLSAPGRESGACVGNRFGLWGRLSVSLGAL